MKTYKEFLAEELNFLPYNFRIGVENGTRDGSVGIVGYFVKRSAAIRYEHQMLLLETMKMLRDALKK